MSIVGNQNTVRKTLIRLLALNRSITPFIQQQQTRSINLDKLSNKRITRLESDVELEDTSDYKSRIINRNPRNLEQLSFEKKPAGFWFENSPPTTWNKLVLSQEGGHLNAYLQHWSGRKLVKASTKEEKLAKYFNNPNTTQAVIILAQVISRRCLQSGYLYAGFDENYDKLSPKFTAFFDTVKEHGLTLEEPPEITPRVVSDL